jgi:hypothetical protein
MASFKISIEILRQAVLSFRLPMQRVHHCELTAVFSSVAMHPGGKYVFQRQGLLKSTFSGMPGVSILTGLRRRVCERSVRFGVLLNQRLCHIEHWSGRSPETV